jgi:hypothetical protein
MQRRKKEGLNYVRNSRAAVNAGADGKNAAALSEKDLGLYSWKD